MYYQAMVVNEKNSSLFPLTQGFNTFGDPANYTTISITGLDQPRSQINLTKSAILDGALFNSATVDTRNIVITIKIKSDHVAVRSLINRVCTIKDLVHFYYGTGGTDYIIDGYVESVAYNLFEQSEVVQISLICPNPNFRILENTNSSYVEVPLLKNPNDPGKFYYTRITTNTPFDIGFQIKFEFRTTVTNFSFQNNKYTESYNLFHDEEDPIVSGDVVVANLYKNDYFIKLIHNNNETNLINRMEALDFFQLEPKLDPDPNTPGNFVGYGAKNGSNYVANLVDATLYYQNEVRGI